MHRTISVRRWTIGLLAAILIVGFALSIIGYIAEMPWHPWFAERLSDQFALIYFGGILIAALIMTLSRNVAAWYISSVVLLYGGSIWKVVGAKAPSLSSAAGGLLVVWCLIVLMRRTFHREGG